MEAYDILTSVKQLEKSGMERSESEAVARVIQAAVAPLATNESLLGTNEGLKATNGTVAVLKDDVAELKVDVAALKVDVAELKTDVAELKGDVVKLDAKITTEVHKMGASLTWRLTTLIFLINGLFFAFERTL